MIKLYGVARSRAQRCLWMLEELGVPYERELVGVGSAGSHGEAYRAINPNGRLPALTDDGLVLWESLAINLYLAEKYGPAQGTELWPADAAGHARCCMWTLWAATELEVEALRALRHRMLYPEEKRDPAEYDQAVQTLQAPLAVLEGELAGHGHLLGEAFTVADLNVATVLAWAYRARMPMEDAPNVKAWLKRCLDRPAQRKVVEMMRAEG